VLLFSFGKEASECSGGLLPFWLVIFITYSLLSIRMSPLSYLKFMIWVYLVLVKLWSYLSTYGDGIMLYCYLWLARKPEFEVGVSLVIY
jgi:hypothetical protein